MKEESKGKEVKEKSQQNEGRMLPTQKNRLRRNVVITYLRNCTILKFLGLLGHVTLNIPAL